MCVCVQGCRDAQLFWEGLCGEFRIPRFVDRGHRGYPVLVLVLVARPKDDGRRQRTTNMSCAYAAAAADERRRATAAGAAAAAAAGAAGAPMRIRVSQGPQAPIPRPFAEPRGTISEIRNPKPLLGPLIGQARRVLPGDVWATAVPLWALWFRCQIWC